MEQPRGDLVIAGAGSVGGGTFRDVRVGGAGEITGDLECAQLTVGGAVTVDGNVKAEHVKIGGTATIRGSLTGGEFKVGGTAEISGDLDVRELGVFGTTTVKGKVQAEEIELKGVLRIANDCSAEVFSSKGGFTIDGMLNAGSIDVTLHGKCEVKEIGGGTIRVSRTSNSTLEGLLRFIFPHNRTLTAESIEGDDVRLEYTKARVVRGKRVTLGPGCELDLVEYQEELRKAGGAAVREERKL